MESKDCCGCGYFSPDFSSGMSLWKLTQRANIAGIREVMLCDRIDSFRSASHSFPKKMAKQSVKLIFFGRENYGGNYVIWPWQFKCFFSVINCLNVSLGNMIRNIYGFLEWVFVCAVLCESIQYIYRPRTRILLTYC